MQNVEHVMQQSVSEGLVANWTTRTLTLISCCSFLQILLRVGINFLSLYQDCQNNPVHAQTLCMQLTFLMIPTVQHFEVLFHS